MAGLSGISIPNTYGTWPGGGGDNPDNLGEALRNSNYPNLTVNASGGDAKINSGNCN